MEDEKKFYETICRVCLTYGNSENMVSLIDYSSDDRLSCYGKAIEIFTNVSIKNDCLPNKMCCKCLFLLKQAIIFRKTCESSNEKLEKLMRKFRGSECDLKEKLCDYITFKDGFPDECRPKTSQTHPVPMIEKQNESKAEVLVKKEIELEFDNDDNMSYDDLFFHDYKEKPKPNPEEEDIDSLLENMDVVAELTPIDLQMYMKRYPKKKKKIKSRPKRILKRQKFINRRRIEEKQKRKKNYQPHTKDDLYCNICSKTLANPDSYQAHVQRHTGGKYICEQCGRTFVTNAELKYHLASTHDIGAQYICKQCGFKAPKRYELLCHERIHSGERPFTCDKCGLTFRTRFIWKKHAIYHTEKTLQCQQCPKKFHLKGELMAHVNGVHERMYIYACSHCDVTYAKTGTVRRHMTEKHGIAREMQGKIKRINLVKPTPRGRPLC